MIPTMVADPVRGRTRRRISRPWGSRFSTRVSARARARSSPLRSRVRRSSRSNEGKILVPLLLEQLARSGSTLYVISVANSAIRATRAIDKPAVLLEENLNLSEVLGEGPKQTGGWRQIIMATPGIVDLSNLTGSFIPFHTTEAARIAAGDTRPSLESLYGTQAGYVAAVTTAANQLVAERLLLQRDADLRIQQAQATVVLP